MWSVLGHEPDPERRVLGDHARHAPVPFPRDGYGRRDRGRCHRLRTYHPRTGDADSLLLVMMAWFLFYMPQWRRRVRIRQACASRHGSYARSRPGDVARGPASRRSERVPLPKVGRSCWPPSGPFDDDAVVLALEVRSRRDNPYRCEHHGARTARPVRHARVRRARGVHARRFGVGRRPVELAHSLGVTVERLRIRSPRPCQALLQLASERRPGLLVFGADPRGWASNDSGESVRAIREGAGCLIWDVPGARGMRKAHVRLHARRCDASERPPIVPISEPNISGPWIEGVPTPSRWAWLEAAG